jgi:hypothetical protein
VLYLRSRRKRFAAQYFRDALKRGASFIPFAAFIFVLPLPLLLIFEAGQLLGEEGGISLEGQERVLAFWAAQYPLTLIVYHTLSARMQKDGFYDSPRPSVLKGMALDCLKHSILLGLIVAVLLATDQKPRPESLMELKNTLSRMFTAS